MTWWNNLGRLPSTFALGLVLWAFVRAIGDRFHNAGGR